jgi:uncharacterized Fe-S cluster-containing protein
MSATTSAARILEGLPGLDCGLCGYRSCAELAEAAATRPGLLERCTQREATASPFSTGGLPPLPMAPPPAPAIASGSGSCESCGLAAPPNGRDWKDHLGREYDFVLQTFPEEPGPRETILPHNPLLTREMSIEVGDVLIGRPLGMSCGCPITHCGVVTQVDPRTGVLVWCVTGPLRARATGFKDIGYYSAQAYEGLILESRADLRLGARYWFLPRRCMLQWRHSGLINFLSRTPRGFQVRIEGLMIG